MNSPLKNLKIASPCSADWNNMIGDDRVRFCGQCGLNVYNLSNMSQIEAERLIMEREGKLCVRFYVRADGTVLTSDCPVGWAAYKQRMRKIATAVASFIFTFIAGLGIYNYFFKPSPAKGGSEVLMGTIAVAPASQPPVVSDVLMDKVVAQPLMGTPVPLPARPEYKLRRSLPVLDR